ncbi:glycosyltransferase [Prolixibacteraceae bacterium]|nr:glycosyltransferase [Prolixibacteraceae bacterium]
MTNNKRVLIITYYWPPCGGVAIFRPLMMAKHLKALGWDVVVYTAEEAFYPSYDYSTEVPSDIEVIYGKIWEPYKLFKKFAGRKKEDSSNPVYVRDKKLSWKDQLSIWIRGNLFIPDARKYWIKPSIDRLSSYLEEHPVDVVISTGPPHSSNMIGLGVSQQCGLPLLVDFQDPWTQVDYYKMLKISGWADKQHREMERQLFAGANAITIASPSWAQDLESIGAKQVTPLLLGYEESELLGLQREETGFQLVHAGILGYDRSPITLIDVLSDLCKGNKAFATDLSILFAGVVDIGLKEYITYKGLDEHTEYTGNVEKRMALQYNMNASILLLPLNKADNVKGRIPGKLYENLRTGNPILCLGPQDSDVGHIIESCGAGITLSYDAYDEMKQFILSCYDHWKKGTKRSASAKVRNYDVANQMAILSDLLDQINH